MKEAVSKGQPFFVYAISSPKHDLRGILINAFGVYSDSASNELAAKLKVH